MSLPFETFNGFRFSVRYQAGSRSGPGKPASPSIHWAEGNSRVVHIDNEISVCLLVNGAGVAEVTPICVENTNSVLDRGLPEFGCTARHAELLGRMGLLELPACVEMACSSMEQLWRTCN